MVVHQVRLQENFEPNLVIGSRNDLEAVLREGGAVSGEASDLVGSVEGRFVEEWTSALRKLVARSQYAERQGYGLGYEKAIRRMKSAAKTLGDAERITLDRVVNVMHPPEAFAYPEPPTPEEAATSRLLKETRTDNVVDAVEVALGWRDGQTASADWALAEVGEAGKISQKFQDTPSCKGPHNFLPKVPPKKGLESPSEPPNPEVQDARIRSLEANLERFVHACAQLTMHPEGNASFALDSDDPTTIAIGWLETGGQWRHRWETLVEGIGQGFEAKEQFDPDRITVEAVDHVREVAKERDGFTHLGDAEPRSLGRLRVTAINVRQTLLDILSRELTDSFGAVDTTTVPDVEWMHDRMTRAVEALDEVLPADEEPTKAARDGRRRLHRNLTKLGTDGAQESAEVHLESEVAHA